MYSAERLRYRGAVLRAVRAGVQLVRTLHGDAHGWFYGRAESAAKDLLDLGGPDPRGFIEFHRISHVQALTVGYVHDLVERRWGRIGIGGGDLLSRPREHARVLRLAAFLSRVRAVSSGSRDFDGSHALKACYHRSDR